MAWQAICIGANVGGVAGKLADDVNTGRARRPVCESTDDTWDIKDNGWDVGAANCDGDVGDGREGSDDRGEDLKGLEGI